jgi:hypothetical protein
MGRALLDHFPAALPAGAVHDGRPRGRSLVANLHAHGAVFGAHLAVVGHEAGVPGRGQDVLDADAGPARAGAVVIPLSPPPGSGLGDSGRVPAGGDAGEAGAGDDILRGLADQSGFVLVVGHRVPRRRSVGNSESII